MSYRRSSRSSTDRPEGGRTVSFDQRASRHSTGAKEEFLAPEEGEEATELVGKDPKMLAIYFGLMVFIGLGNKIFNKLMTIPMHSKTPCYYILFCIVSTCPVDYPNFLNLLTTSMYVPVCFAYIIPMARNGGIPKEQLDLPYKPFAVMGGLDAIAGIMQVFAATYLPGPIIILMVRTHFYLAAKHT
jgi:hypothetical protein